jgi:hypothetical protein
MSSKQREALSDACYAMFNFLKTHYGSCYEEMANALDKAKAALAEPLKNCEVGTAEEQYARFKKWCEGEFYKRPMNPLTGEPCKSCPCYSVSANGVDGCNYLRWAHMPYESEGK